MLVKTFQAGSMSEALKMVKAELGPDAMILSSKEEKKKGIFGFFRKAVYKITAAVDQTPRPVRPAPNPYAQEQNEVSSTREEFQKSMLEPLVREIRELRDRVDSLKARENAAPVADEKRAGVEKPVKTDKAVPVAEGAGKEGFVPLNGALTDKEKLRKILMDVVGGAREKESPPTEGKKGAVKLAPPSDREELQSSAGSENCTPSLDEMLERSGLRKEVREKLLDAVGELDTAETDIRASLKTALAGMVKCSNQTRSKRKGPRLLALVGPTGVGKTTTVAKLAALYSLRRKAKVALVTTDTFRAGAVEQLKTYAKVLGIQMETAATGAELAKALEKHGDKDLVLIDTAGKSAMDNGRMDELAVLLEADPAIEKHLCLSATTRDEDLQEIVEQFKSLPVHRVLFTKLDEGRRLGCVVNVAVENDLSISYLTNGQRVPEDIEPANGKKIANMVLGALG